MSEVSGVSSSGSFHTNENRNVSEKKSDTLPNIGDLLSGEVEPKAEKITEFDIPLVEKPDKSENEKLKNDESKTTEKEITGKQSDIEVKVSSTGIITTYEVNNNNNSKTSKLVDKNKEYEIRISNNGIYETVKKEKSNIN